jgi:hypothetical protein
MKTMDSALPEPSGHEQQSLDLSKRTPNTSPILEMDKPTHPRPATCSISYL